MKNKIIEVVAPTHFGIPPEYTEHAMCFAEYYMQYNSNNADLTTNFFKTLVKNLYLPNGYLLNYSNSGLEELVKSLDALIDHKINVNTSQCQKRK